MAHQPPTILFLKQSFVETQVRLLSRPLALDPSWQQQQQSRTTTQDPLPAAAVDEALHRANRALAEHTRRVYPPQSTRIVAEQINKLYEPGLAHHPDDEDDDDDDGAQPRRGADLTDAATIASLPSAWPVTADTIAFPMESSRYAELAASLTTLSARRAETLERVRRLRRIQAALRPFTPDAATAVADDEDGPISTIQENLAARNGQVEKELEKMRMLLVKVGARVSKLPAPAQRTGDDDDDDDGVTVESPAVVQKKKVDELMDLY